MKLKSSVRIKTVNEYLVRFFAAGLAYEHLYNDELTITSANDGVHGTKGSYHYLDQAWDVRINDVPKEVAIRRREFLAAELGYGWDVIIERFADHANDHIHAERDTRTYPEK